MMRIFRRHFVITFYIDAMPYDTLHTLPIVSRFFLRYEMH